MSRSKRFVAGTIAGYGSIGANILFTLLSVPLALTYLDKEQFGLWVLAVQVNGYLSMVELGMTNAILRFIADYKDEVNGGSYGSYLLTGGLVFASQGALIASLGFVFSWFAPVLFSIPAHLAADFRFLLILLSCFSGMSVAMRSMVSPLWAFQRMDLINIGFTCGTLLSLAALWLGFNQGWGIVAFPIAQAPAGIGMPVLYFWICKRNRYFPQKGHWGKPSWHIFRKIFAYGKDVFLVQIGNQLINASQIIIISRIIGLSAAAVYAVSTKVYALGMLFLNNPLSCAAPGLTELYVRGEYERFVSRYWDLIRITLIGSAVIAFGIAAGNRSFVSLWTRGAIEWPWVCDLLLAILLVLRNLNNGFNNLFSVTKSWRSVRYLYLTEGLIFVPLAILCAKWFGITGVVAASLLAHLITTAPLSGIAVFRVIGSLAQIWKPLLLSIILVSVGTCFAWMCNSILIIQNVIQLLVVALMALMMVIIYLLLEYRRRS